MTTPRVQAVPVELLEALAAEYVDPAESRRTTTPAPSANGTHKRPGPTPRASGASPAQRARAYLKKIPDSVQGDHGSNPCFYAACLLVIDFDLSEEEAWPLLVEYSEAKGHPPSGEAELRHKLADALKKRAEDPGRVGRNLREGRREANGVNRHVRERNTYQGEEKGDAWEGPVESPSGDGQGVNNGEPVPSRPRRPAMLPPYQPFPLEALPSPAREYVVQAAKALRCDPAFVALPVLAALASAIGNSRVVRLKRGWQEPAVLWTVIVGDSGTLKSPAYLKAVEHLYGVQRRLLNEYREDCNTYQERLQQYKAAKKAYETAQKKPKAGDEDSLADSPPHPGDPPEEPVYRRVICDDITIEGLASLLEDNPRGVLSARDELAGWFGSFCRYKGSKGGSDLPKWLEAHRAGTWIVDRKTGEKKHYFVRRATVSVTGGIQPRVLAETLTTEFLAAGLAARLLMAMPPKVRKEWSEAEVSEEAEQAYHDVLDKLYKLDLDKKDGERGPHVIKLSHGAKEAWVRFYNEWAAEQLNAEGELAAAYSKLEGCAARLALLHHTVTYAHQETDSTVVIDARSMEAGITLARWFANEARRLYGMLSETLEEAETRRLVEYVASKDGRRITARMLQKSNSRKYPSAEAAEAALQGLVLKKLAVWVQQEAGPKGGQPGKWCVLVPQPDTDTPACDGTTDTTDTTPCAGVGSLEDGADTTPDTTPA